MAGKRGLSKQTTTPPGKLGRAVDEDPAYVLLFTIIEQMKDFKPDWSAVAKAMGLASAAAAEKRYHRIKLAQQTLQKGVHTKNAVAKAKKPAASKVDADTEDEDVGPTPKKLKITAKGRKATYDAEEDDEDDENA